MLGKGWERFFFWDSWRFFSGGKGDSCQGRGWRNSSQGKGNSFQKGGESPHISQCLLCNLLEKVKCCVGGDSSWGVGEILAREEVGGILSRGREILSRSRRESSHFPVSFV